MIYSKEDYAPRIKPARPIPVTVTVVTTIPAIKTPETIASNACLNLTPKTNAAAQPDQAPVAGRGIATKIVSARSPYFSKLSVLFLRVRENSHAKKLSKIV
jgi:hypothetical protein